MSFEIAVIGLGDAGEPVAGRLVKGGATVRAWDPDEQMRAAARAEGSVTVLDGLADVLGPMAEPRTILVARREEGGAAIWELAALLRPGDLVLDASCPHFNDATDREGAFAGRGARYLDAGIVGGPWGGDLGFAVVVGGRAETVEQAKPVLVALAAGGTAWMRCGPTGSGCFVRMVYETLGQAAQGAFARGLGFLRQGPHFSVTPLDVVGVWRDGGVATEGLADLCEQYMGRHPFPPPGAAPRDLAPSAAQALAMSLLPSTRGVSDMMKQMVEAVQKAPAAKS